MAEQQLEFVHGLIRAAEEMNLSVISDMMHPDHVHVTRPSSVNIPKQNKAQCLEYYEKIFDNWTKVEPSTITALANTPGKVVAHITSDVTLKSGSTITYESILALGIDEDSSGRKRVKHAEEFIDTNAFTNCFAPFIAATT